MVAIEEFVDFQALARVAPIGLGLLAFIFFPRNYKSRSPARNRRRRNAGPVTVNIEEPTVPSLSEPDPLTDGKDELDGDETIDLQAQEVQTTPIEEDRTQLVLELEAERSRKGFKTGWIYHRCKEKGLLRELSQLRRQGRVTNPFGATATAAMPAPIGSPKLSIELVPASCWYSNLRSLLTDNQWKILKTAAYKAANNRCQICGGRGPKWPVEAHEIWSYDDSLRSQKLVAIQALCPSCHEVKHMGLASIKGRADVAQSHLQRVNGWDDEVADAYIRDQFDIWDRRSAVRWGADLSRLVEYGFGAEEVAQLEAAANGERG